MKIILALLALTGCVHQPSMVEKTCGDEGVRLNGERLVFCKNGTIWRKHDNYLSEIFSSTSEVDDE